MLVFNLLLIKLYEFTQLYVDFLACIFSGIILLAEHWEQSESRGYQILKDLFYSHSITILFKYANESFLNYCKLSFKYKLLGPLYSDLSNRMWHFIKRLFWGRFMYLVFMNYEVTPKLVFRCVVNFGGVIEWYQSISYREIGHFQNLNYNWFSKRKKNLKSFTIVRYPRTLAPR